VSLRLLSIRLYFFLDRVWRWLYRLFFFWRRSRGAEVFLERYRADQVLAVSETERSLAPSLEKCLHCSLCTLSCDAIQKGVAPSSFEPKQIVGVFGKYTHDSEIFLEEWFPCTSCQACTVLCPNSVPVHAMAEQIVNRRDRLGVNQPQSTF
jgi:heterodisulfide reductase subunit C